MFQSLIGIKSDFRFTISVGLISLTLFQSLIGIKSDFRLSVPFFSQRDNELVSVPDRD